jgi:tripartite-type tricarboxylate transporter receptor subunit TctC
MRSCSRPASSWVAVVLIALGVGPPASASAQGKDAGGGIPSETYPVKPVRMVVPLAPGGGSDIVGRIVAQALTEQWGQAVVVDNRPGAGGTIGNAIVAASIPDGYTLLVSSSTMAISPSLYRSAPSDIIRDFAADPARESAEHRGDNPGCGNL